MLVDDRKYHIEQFKAFGKGAKQFYLRHGFAQSYQEAPT